MSTASTRIPKPKDWQEFERQIEILAQCVLGDPTAKGNGRTGQRQKGVDVFGWRPGKIAVGFQCKEHFEEPVTEKELRDEVKKAEQFRPKLKEFILVTTADRDAKIQEVARLMTEERDDFSVDVWSWEDIEGHVAKHPEAIKAFDPTYSPLIVEELREYQDQGVNRIIAELQSLRAGGNSVATESAAAVQDEDESTKLHGQITLVQNMIDEGDVIAAIPLLDRLVAKEQAQASPSEIYRLNVAKAGIAIKRERFEEAGRILVDAAREYPAHKNAESNLAIGLLLSGESEEAEATALGALKRNPENQKMAETLAQARAQQGKEDLFADIPSKLLDSSIMLGLKSTVARMKGDQGWRKLAIDGARSYPEDKFLKRFAAEAIVDECLEKAPEFIVGEPAGPISREDIAHAADVLVGQIANLREIEGEVPVSLAHNAALACRLDDRFDKAFEILEGAIADHPDEVELVEQVAMHYVQTGEAAKAVPLLEPMERSSKRDLTLAAALIELDRYAEAKAVLDEQQSPEKLNLPQFQFFGVHFEWYRKQADFDGARAFFSGLAKNHPGDLLPLLFRAKIERLAEDETAYSEALDAAIELVDGNSSFGVIHELADEAFRGQHYEIAVDLLKDRVAVDHENEPLSLCIAAAMNGDLHRTASELLDRVPEGLAEERWYRRVRIALANKIGSDRTLPLLNKYLTSFPEDVEMRTLRIGLWQTSGLTGKIRKDIEATDFAGLEGSPFARMQYFRLATAYGDGAKSLPFAYRLLLENWNSVDCHTGYHGLFLSNITISGIDLSPTKIDVATVCRVLTDKNEDRWYRVEEQKPAVFGDEWLSPDDPLAETLMGHAAGDVVEVEGAHGNFKLTIAEVKSVYLDTFHRSISRFNDRFPNSGAMLQMSIDTEAEDPFFEMKRMTRRLSERNRETINIYRDNPISIVWLAGLLGKDEIECSIGLPAETGIPFRVCQGTSDERETAFEIIDQNDEHGVVVDAVTAVLIKRLKLEEAIKAVCGPLKATATTIERLTERFHEAEGMLGRQMGTFGYQDGQYVLTEHTDEQIQSVIEVRKDELEWARENLEIVDALPSRELDREARQMADMVGLNAIAPALAASGAGLPILADDFGIRLWAKAALDVDGLWLQPILMRARDQGAIDEGQYATAILDMAEAGFSYISLDNRTLLHALRKADFDVSSVEKPLNILLGKSADINRNLFIAMATLVALKDEDCPPMTPYKLASQIARAATYPRWDQVDKILSAMSAVPFPGMAKHLQSWKQWNSLGSA